MFKKFKLILRNATHPSRGSSTVKTGLYMFDEWLYQENQRSVPDPELVQLLFNHDRMNL